ncbi:LOW QUALITY PROTEIN: 39S ribosomal protein S30, mitochondrial [Ctenopharyngodon idella]|uniref:LOW QUALITY PROTEIN: 39S ribosomal protein S30, mitochondrial n=1 Tax=Ctenopharyngodon idella TaxID=7959 RepID=UPI00222E406D|nr:LOW QUALITY PROTEIN: 39S ribosomal protein S30, mitochondrial [Ctenopharyngodon idella]
MASCSRLPLHPFLSTTSARLVCNRNVQVEASTAKSLYPPILPSRTAKSKSAKRRVVTEFFEQLRSRTAQEKIRALTRVQRKKYVIYPPTFALNADKWYQHYTKTAYLSGLPEKYTHAESAPVIDESVLSEVRSVVCSFILQEHWYLKKGRTFIHKEQEQFVTPFLRNMVCGLKNLLAKENPVLCLSSLDFDPQVNYYWLRGERTIPAGHRSGRIEPMRFQIDDKPHSQIRIPQQLPEFVPLEAETSAEVPAISLAPDRLPLFRRQYDNNIFIGAKLEDPCSYGHTQFHMVPDRFRRDKMSKKGLSDQVEVSLRANGIASLFAWTGAQAMYQGFWSEEDVSRPFVSQAVITDGQFFSFFCYQLNTLALSPRADGNNARKNLCWGTESMRLYERVTDGDIVGWNDAVLRLLLQFLLNKPQ